MTSPRIYDALGAFMAVSAVADANHAAFVTHTLDAVDWRWACSRCGGFRA
jgi:hypothetical protein